VSVGASPASAAAAVTHVVVADGYDVLVGVGLLDALGRLLAERAGAHRVVVVTDETVAALHLARTTASLAAAGIGSPVVLTVPPGEHHKTREQWARLTDAMLAAGGGRDTTVVALGGGVVGDLAGFVAATFMRGVPVVQVPTTLLAMVDASVGGKTAVDTPHGKNLVGAFHPPALVLADPAVLATLPPDQRRSGLAEALKHGIIADEGHFDAVLALAPAATAPAWTPDDAFVAQLARSIAIKADVVRQDPRERGLRKILNFGHTIGHAVEQLSGYALLHGEAIAIGMVAEATAAELGGIAAVGTAGRVREAMRAAGLPDRRPDAIAPDAVLGAARGDKKARRGVAEYAVPLRIGAMAGSERGWAVPLDDALLREALA
jgi:3-dehydroquinate synthase